MEQIDFEIDDVTVETTNDHDKLINRDLPEQHPIEAIDGLTDALDAKANENQGEENAGKFWKVDEDGSLIFAEAGGGGGSVETITINGETLAPIDGDIDLGTVVTDLTAYRTAAAQDIIDAGKADTTDIPTKTSDLQNDSGFLTEHQSLSAYRTATAQDLIDSALSGMVDDINDLIPAQATAQNQLADKAFVDSKTQILLITFSHDAPSGDITEAENITCDKTVDEIIDAINNNNVIVGRWIAWKDDESGEKDWSYSVCNYVGDYIPDYLEFTYTYYGENEIQNIFIDVSIGNDAADTDITVYQYHYERYDSSRFDNVHNTIIFRGNLTGDPENPISTNENYNSIASVLDSIVYYQEDVSFSLYQVNSLKARCRLLWYNGYSGSVAFEGERVVDYYWGEGGRQIKKELCHIEFSRDGSYSFSMYPFVVNKE